MSVVEGIAAPRRNWLETLDSFAQRIGDRFNPILIKEARQALKSRQFVLTFSLLLIAAWAWTAAAILMLMPGIYYVPSGKTFLYGYYIVLAVPMLLVVPLAAHRSLASEVDDGTLDLLSVTSLSPLQIITGKLASAALQMMLYLVTLFPCVAFCYVLRGVDLMTIANVLGLTIVVASLLTVAGLFLAALPGGRAGQLGMLVAMLVLVAVAEMFCGTLAFSLIDYGFNESPQGFLYVMTSGLVFTVTLSLVMLRAAAAELAPPSENRSSPIRRMLLLHQSVMVGCLAYGMLTSQLYDDFVLSVLYYAAFFWTVVGTMMVGESNFLTPRVRRDLPSSFLTRSLFVWMTPGPTTGLVFAILCFTVFSICLVVLGTIAPRAEMLGMASMPVGDLEPHIWMLAGYMMLFMSATRGFMYAIRKRNHTRPVFALAILVIVAGMFALVPYFITLHLNEYRSISWSYWQITNWPWTTAFLIEGRLAPDVPFVIFLIGTLAFAVALLSSGRAVLPLRVATPERVLEERRRRRGDTDPTSPVADPFAP